MRALRLYDRVIIIGTFHTGEKGIIKSGSSTGVFSVEINDVEYGFLSRELELDEKEMIKVYGLQVLNEVSLCKTR